MVRYLVANPLTGAVVVLGLTIGGFVLWFKADKPLFGIPVVGAAAYLAYLLWRALAGGP